MYSTVDYHNHPILDATPTDTENVMELENSGVIENVAYTTEYDKVEAFELSLTPVRLRVSAFPFTFLPFRLSLKSQGCNAIPEINSFWTFYPVQLSKSLLFYSGRC